MILMEFELEDNWLKEFEETDKKYKKFYKEDINEISFFYLYLNENNKIDVIDREVICLKEANKINQLDLIDMLNNKSKRDGVRYNLSEIFLFLPELNESEIIPFLKGKVNLDDSSIKKIYHIEDIILSPVIYFLSNLNCVNVLFRIPKSTSEYNKTKKVFITSSKHKNKTYKQKYLKKY